MNTVESNGFDDIRRIRRELAELRGQRNAVIREHLALVTNETAIELINSLGWGLCDRLKTTRKLLEDCFDYDFPAQRFLKESAEAAFANEEGFHIIKNNHAILLVAQKELDTVVKANEAKAKVSSPKEIYADGLKAILLAWERIGVVITYNDLLEIAENGFVQQFDDLTSFPYQWLSGYLSSWVRLDKGMRLTRRLEQQGDGSVEDELIVSVLGEIASRLPELRSYTNVADLLRNIKTAITSTSRTDEEALWSIGMHPFSRDAVILSESGEVVEDDILDRFDHIDAFLAKEDALWLIEQAQKVLSEQEFQVLLLDIADYDKKPSLREVSEIVGTTIKTVDSCRRRYRDKLKAILSSAA